MRMRCGGLPSSFIVVSSVSTIAIAIVLQEHLVGAGKEDTKLEMARHFELCDSDADGYLTFSQFLRWVELCDLNPEDHLQVGGIVPCHAVLEIERACEKRDFSAQHAWEKDGRRM